MKRIKIKDEIYALVDDDMHDRLNAHRWCLSKSYVRRSVILYKKRRNVSMHREVMGLSPDSKLIVDHINHDLLDNRRSNLRVVTKYQNDLNKRRVRRKYSEFQGVTKNSSKNTSYPWYVQIMKNGKNYYIGRFKSEVVAALAYNEKAIELFGEYAYLNKFA